MRGSVPEEQAFRDVTHNRVDRPRVFQLLGHQSFETVNWRIRDDRVVQHDRRVSTGEAANVSVLLFLVVQGIVTSHILILDCSYTF